MPLEVNSENKGGGDMDAAETGLCSFKVVVWRGEGSSRDTWSLEGPGHLPLKGLVGGNPSARRGGRGRREYTMRL